MSIFLQITLWQDLISQSRLVDIISVTFACLSSFYSRASSDTCLGCDANVETSINESGLPRDSRIQLLDILVSISRSRSIAPYQNGTM